jgi:hypothetical protein
MSAMNLRDGARGGAISFLDMHTSNTVKRLAILQDRPQVPASFKCRVSRRR